MSINAVLSLSSALEANSGQGGVDLDAAAGTPPTPTVIAAMVDAMNAELGNPSSAHWRGENARILLANARDSVVKLAKGAVGDGVIFTSGCTEANNFVLESFARAGARILTTVVEHPSILNAARHLQAVGASLVLVPVDGDGALDFDFLRDVVETSDKPVLVSVQAANSETGVMQDLQRVANIVGNARDAVFHSDAAQALGKVPIEMGRGRGPDLLTVSGHKLHGPMGAGAVIQAEDFDATLHPLIHGGDQEHGLRAGTQAMPAIAGFAAACEEWVCHRRDRRAQLSAMRDLLENRLTTIDGVIINGRKGPRAPHISSVTFKDCDGMALLSNLDRRGIAVSQGSACSSRKPEASPVLRAMGVREAEAFATVRFSVSICNQANEIERAAEIIERVVAALRSRR